MLLILINSMRMKITIMKRTAAKKNSFGIPPVAMFTNALGAGDFFVVSIFVESAKYNKSRNNIFIFSSIKMPPHFYKQTKSLLRHKVSK